MLQFVGWLYQNSQSILHFSVSHPLHPCQHPIPLVLYSTVTKPPLFKQWNPTRAESIMTIPTHSCTYSVSYSPHSPALLSSVSSDSHLRVFDLRIPASVSNHLTVSIPLHQPGTISAPTRPGYLPRPTLPPAEALTHDWNKYRSTIVAAAGVDRFIRTFDIRAPNQGPLAVLAGHDYAVRKISWSPHLSDVLLSASYDMTCRVWTDGSAIGNGSRVTDEEEPGRPLPPFRGQGRELGRMERHTEFATGVDWCLFGNEGWCATCGWDERVLVWDVRAL